MTVAELIETLSGFDKSLIVYYEAETGPVDISEVHQTPIVWISEGEAGDGIVLGSVGSAEMWEKWVDEQRDHREKYLKLFPA